MQEPCQQNTEKERREKWEKAIFMNGFRDGVKVMLDAFKEEVGGKQSPFIQLFLLEGVEQGIQEIFYAWHISSAELNAVIGYLNEFLAEAKRIIDIDARKESN